MTFTKIFPVHLKLNRPGYLEQDLSSIGLGSDKQVSKGMFEKIPTDVLIPNFFLYVWCIYLDLRCVKYLSHFSCCTTLFMYNITCIFNKLFDWFKYFRRFIIKTLLTLIFLVFVNPSLITLLSLQNLERVVSFSFQCMDLFLKKTQPSWQISFQIKKEKWLSTFETCLH